MDFRPAQMILLFLMRLVNKKIDTGDFNFKVRLEDVETLNELAIKTSLDFTKISYGVLPLVAQKL